VRTSTAATCGSSSTPVWPAGRKGAPEQVAEHPQVFASLTAPSLGAVHNRPDDGRPCRYGKRHQVDDPEFSDAIREAAGRARLQGDAGDGDTVDVRFGDQLRPAS
jgi:hypothetical protein